MRSKKNSSTKFKNKYSYNLFNKVFKNFKKLRVLILGEIIVDKYCFGKAIGKSGKEPYLVFNEKHSENYQG